MTLARENVENGVFDDVNKETLGILLKLKDSPANPITSTIIEGIIKNGTNSRR